MQCLIACCSQPEANSDVISSRFVGPIFPDSHVKFGDPRGTSWWGRIKRRATKIQPKAVGSGIFGRYPNFDQYRSEVAGDVISGVAIDYVGVDVLVRATFGEIGLNNGRPNYFTL